MKKNSSFSEQEVKLFTELNYSDLVENEFFQQQPLLLYELAIRKCFCMNVQTPAADALRRGYNAYAEGVAYRMSDKFNELISF